MAAAAPVRAQPIVHYTTLGISPGATLEQIQDAYYRLLVQWHPVNNPGNVEGATVRFNAVLNAYEALTAPAPREESKAERDARAGESAGAEAKDAVHRSETQRMKGASTRPAEGAAEIKRSKMLQEERGSLSRKIPAHLFPEEIEAMKNEIRAYVTSWSFNKTKAKEAAAREFVREGSEYSFDQLWEAAANKGNLFVILEKYKDISDSRSDFKFSVMKVSTIEAVVTPSLLGSYTYGDGYKQLVDRMQRSGGSGAGGASAVDRSFERFMEDLATLCMGPYYFRLNQFIQEEGGAELVAQYVHNVEEFRRCLSKCGEELADPGRLPPYVFYKLMCACEAHFGKPLALNNEEFFIVVNACIKNLRLSSPERLSFFSKHKEAIVTEEQLINVLQKLIPDNTSYMDLAVDRWKLPANWLLLFDKRLAGLLDQKIDWLLQHIMPRDFMLFLGIFPDVANTLLGKSVVMFELEIQSLKQSFPYDSNQIFTRVKQINFTNPECLVKAIKEFSAFPEKQLELATTKKSEEMGWEGLSSVLVALPQELKFQVLQPELDKETFKSHEHLYDLVVLFRDMPAYQQQILGKWSGVKIPAEEIYSFLPYLPEEKRIDFSLRHTNNMSPDVLKENSQRAWPSEELPFASIVRLWPQEDPRRRDILSQAASYIDRPSDIHKIAALHSDPERLEFVLQMCRKKGYSIDQLEIGLVLHLLSERDKMQLIQTIVAALETGTVQPRKISFLEGVEVLRALPKDIREARQLWLESRVFKDPQTSRELEGLLSDLTVEEKQRFIEKCWNSEKYSPVVGLRFLPETERLSFLLTHVRKYEGYQFDKFNNRCPLVSNSIN